MEKTKFYNACMMLDRLQVELCKDTPYDIPTAEKTRERILKAMDLFEEFDNEEMKGNKLWEI